MSLNLSIRGRQAEVSVNRSFLTDYVTNYFPIKPLFHYANRVNILRSRLEQVFTTTPTYNSTLETT